MRGWHRFGCVPVLADPAVLQAVWRPMALRSPPAVSTSVINRRTTSTRGERPLVLALGLVARDSRLERLHIRAAVGDAPWVELRDLLDDVTDAALGHTRVMFQFQSLHLPIFTAYQASEACHSARSLRHPGQFLLQACDVKVCLLYAH